MPSLVGHFTAPIALRIVRAMPKRLSIAALVASMLPDLDTVAPLFGVAPGTVFAHRGITHSIAFAALVAGCAALIAPTLRSSRLRAAGLVFICALSHPLLDMLTDGGPAVMIGWPFSDARVFAPWRPIRVSPIGAGFFSLRGIETVRSELAWIVLPMIAVALAMRMWKRAMLPDARGRPRA